MMTAWRILIIGTEANRNLVKSAISHWATQPVWCSTLREARDFLPDASLSLIFCEDTLPDGTYHDLLRTVGKPVKDRFVVISSTPDLDEIYDEATELGAFDVIASPCSRSDVQWMVVRATQDVRHAGSPAHR